MSIGDQGRDLIIHLALLLPLNWLLASPRIVGRPPNVQRGVTVAMGVLLTFSSLKIGCELAYKEPSYYDMLDVLPGVSSVDLKKGYKRASLRVHPDKLQAAGAADDEAADEAVEHCRLPGT